MALGTEAAGTVAAAGSGVAELREGDEVWGDDAEALEVRRDQWKNRSKSALAAKERQHRSRLLRATKPTERPHAFSDPLELCKDALEACKFVRRAIQANIGARERLEEVEEALRQLAWGPEDRSSRP
jgi:hypothetical protein